MINIIISGIFGVRHVDESRWRRERRGPKSPGDSKQYEHEMQPPDKVAVEVEKGS
jgi:hypothetical protein